MRQDKRPRLLLSAGNQAAQTAAQDKPMLSELNPEKVCIIIVKMRKLDGLADAPMGDFLHAADEAPQPLVDNWLENMLKTCQDRLVRTVHGLPEGVFFLFPADLLEFTNRASREGAD